MLRAILLASPTCARPTSAATSSAAYLAYERDQPCPSPQDGRGDPLASVRARVRSLAPPPRACRAHAGRGGKPQPIMRMRDRHRTSPCALPKVRPRRRLGAAGREGREPMRLVSLKGSKTTDEAYVLTGENDPAVDARLSTAVAGRRAVASRRPTGGADNVIGVGLTMSWTRAAPRGDGRARLIGLRWSLASAAFRTAPSTSSTRGSGSARWARRRSRRTACFVIE